jgi:hypothetical protein
MCQAEDYSTGTKNSRQQVLLHVSPVRSDLVARLLPSHQNICG